MLLYIFRLSRPETLSITRISYLVDTYGTYKIYAPMDTLSGSISTPSAFSDCHAPIEHMFAGITSTSIDRRGRSDSEPLNFQSPGSCDTVRAIIRLHVRLG